MPDIQLRPYQADSAARIRDAFMRGVRGVLLVSPTGSGKCLARGTPVLMFDGSARLVETIVPGDLLMGPDSQPRRILTVCSGEDELFQVTPTKGEPYIVNRDHILSLIISGTDQTNCAGRSYAPGSVANVSIEEYLRASKTFRHVAKGWKCAVDFPPGALIPDLPPYMLGLWLGDGTATTFSVSKPDEEIKSAVYEYAAILGMAARTDGTHCPTHHIVSPAGSLRGRGNRPNRATNALRDIGVLGNKHVPHVYRVASRVQRLELLAGLMDSDGSMNLFGGFDFISSIKQLSKDVVFIARSLGLAASMAECQKRDQNGRGGTYWRVYIGGDTHVIPTRIPRKRAKQAIRKKDVLRTGIAVKPIGRGAYHGFTLDRDGLFLLGDFTVTHNTVTFSHIAKNAAARGNSTLIVAHRDMLIKQASAKLSDYGVRHGIIMADYMPSPDAMVQVASVQTLVKRVRRQKYNFQLIIVDEAHLSCARTYLEILDKIIADNPHCRILGVTGTPCRLDGRGLGRKKDEKGRQVGGRFEEMIESVSMRELIDDAYAVQPIVYAPLDRLDLTKIPKEKGDYKKGALSTVMNTSVITGNAIDHYRQYAKHIPTATWCVDLKHAHDTCSNFNDSGIKSVMLHGGSTSDERDRAINQLSDGSIYNITFCQLLVEGVDCPAIGCIIGLRPTYSLVGYRQTLGRMSRPIYARGFNLETLEGRFAAMRAGPKGLNGIFLDHAGLTYRHGFQDDDIEWSLEGVPKKGKRDEAGIALRQCPKCRAVFRPADSCPICGHVFETKGRQLKIVEGQLGQLTPEMLRGIEREARKNKRIEVKEAQTLEDFQRIAQDRGYSPGWASIQKRIRDATKKRKTEEAAAQGQLWALNDSQLAALDKEAQDLSTHPKFDREWDL